MKPFVPFVFFVAVSATISTASNITIFALASTHDKGAGQATALLDLDGDGDLDFVSANKGTIHYARNNGGCVFTHAQTIQVDNANGFGMHDLNGDGKMDFMIAQQGGESDPDCRINAGNGAFTPTNLGNESVGCVRTVVFADFDLDGNIDSYHSGSAFQTNHAGNQFHCGLSNGNFGPDIIRTILNPPSPGFWYDTATHPTYGKVEWSNKQSKAAIARDLDDDGRPELIFCSYADRGFQEDEFAVAWVEQQTRGVYILQNNSTPGSPSFSEVAKSALGADAWGTTRNDWNTYSVVPLDYDLDGDFDLFVGATIRGLERTDLCRLYENVSTPGTIKFIERTADAGLESFNQWPVGTRPGRNWAAGAPIDFDNDGWVDIALINREDTASTPYPWVHLLRNKGDKTFEEIPFASHGIGGRAGGRDINYGDLDGDGKLDVIVSDGTVGGYEGTNTTMIYENKSPDANHWIELDIRANGTWAIGGRVTIFKEGTQTIAGLDEVRTDFCYRSKRHPVLHVGLGTVTAVDVQIRTWDGKIYEVTGLQADRVHTINLDHLTPTLARHLPVRTLQEPREKPAGMRRFDIRGRLMAQDNVRRKVARGVAVIQRGCRLRLERLE